MNQKTFVEALEASLQGMSLRELSLKMNRQEAFFSNIISAAKRNGAFNKRTLETVYKALPLLKFSVDNGFVEAPRPRTVSTANHSPEHMKMMRERAIGARAKKMQRMSKKTNVEGISTHELAIQISKLRETLRVVLPNAAHLI